MSWSDNRNPEALPHTMRNELLSDVQVVQRLERQLSSAHNSLSSLEEIHYKEIHAGVRRDGKMSIVRRFFCLFVLFDLLLISLTWLICIMLMDSNNLIEILKMQVVFYKITTSLFDIVMAAFCRFTVLLLFYGFLQLNTTFFVALTTLATCLFLIFKVVYYSWSTASQPAFQVILILISFVIAWSETWFLDFRVLPQEQFAFNYTQSADRVSETLSVLLLDPNLRSPVMRHFLRNVVSGVGHLTESTASFYSPTGSPDDSEEEAENQKMVGKLSNEEYLKRGKNTLEVVWNILNDCDWKLQKRSSNGDAVYFKQEVHLGKVFLLRTKVNVQAQKLLQELFANVDKFPSWNKNFLESKRIQVIDEHTDITYQVSAPGGNGVISSRDFINLRHWDKKGDCYVLAGISIPYPTLPPKKNYVRGENGPCCWVMRPSGENYDSCIFEFLLNTNLKGWIPKYVLENSLTAALLDYSTCLREHCNSISRMEAT